MKNIFALVILFIFLLSFPAHAVNKYYWATGLTGGGSALDGIDGASLADGDAALVVYDNAGTYEFYSYRLEDYAADPPAESSPDTITPNDNSGDKRWKLLKIYASGLVVSRTDNPSCSSFYEATSDGDAYVQLCAFAKGTGYTAGIAKTATIPPIDGPLFGSCTVSHDYGGAAVTKALSIAESHCSYFSVTNANGAVELNIPAAIPGKTYTIYNNSGQTLTFKVSGATGGAIANGKYGFYTTHSSDVIEVWEQP